MKNTMMSVQDAAKCIQSGAITIIAGSENALRQLPTGNWIGGTSVYFLTKDGGRVDYENVFVTEIAAATECDVRHYLGPALSDMTRDRYKNGLSLILIPAFSRAHSDFAILGAEFPGLFNQPLMGWISGVHLDKIETETAKVFDGKTGICHDEGAAVMHVALPPELVPEIDIVNLFEQDTDSEVFTFSEGGFIVKNARINGKKVDLASYLKVTRADTTLPLVANYAGAMINVSYLNVEHEDGVQFAAPLVPGVEYRLARNPGAYAPAFAKACGTAGSDELSCNCLLNYQYGELEGKTTGSYTGPATFGEIAYILLNQTLVRLNLQDAAAG